MPKWLVTGGSGFLGRHVLDALASDSTPGTRVIVVGRRRPGGSPAEDFHCCDLGDFKRLREIITAIRPDYVIHTAGRTPPAPVWAYYQENTRATVHLVAALQAARRRVRLVLAASAAELGPVPRDKLPVGEDFPCNPTDHYGLSKWFATKSGLLARPPVEVSAARVFNPIGPGLPPSQAFGHFAAQLVDSSPEPRTLKVGDLDSCRDFIDARDVATALVALAKHGRPAQVYHVGTGQSHRVGEGLEYLVGLCGRAVEVERTPTSRRATDSRADIRRLQSDTGWAPRITFQQSLVDLWTEASRIARPGRVA
jgi:GDP-4-dehydro-6-deoxy-D-mannose reductase